MLSKIAEVVTAIGDFISTVVSFVVDFLKDIFQVIVLVGKTVVHLPEYFSWLPAAAVSIILVIFGVVVIYKITGREG